MAENSKEDRESILRYLKARAARILAESEETGSLDTGEALEVLELVAELGLS